MEPLESVTDDIANPSTDVVETTAQMIDTSVLDELKSLSQATGRDIVGKSVNFFIEQTPEDVATMRLAAKQADLETLGTLAHSLKSSGANLGAMKFSKLCEALEKSAREGDMVSSLTHLQSIESLFPGVLDELRQHVDEESVFHAQTFSA